MGRKPNPLILEFFERGPKLDDASNRYQHTCKACGEVFPKGRTDSLNNHLTKKCQVIPLRDRQRAALQIHELPDIPDGDPNISQKANGGLNSRRAVDLPFAGSRRLTGLEALAEASRHFAKDVTPVDSQTAAADDSAIDPSLRDFITSEISKDVHGATSSNAIATSSAAFDNIPFPPMQFSDSPISSPQMAVLALPSASTIKDPSALSLIAASASNLEPMSGYAALPLEPGTEVSSFDSYDKPFDTNGPKFVSTWPLHQADQADDAKYPTMALIPRAATYPRAIAINPNGPRRGSSADNAASQGEIRHKVRGRFTDSRREEVQKVRKMGACIRCRMLRKPCSGDSPCSTCAGIESARLWKLPCTRARVADEIQLYSVGLYSTVAFHKVNYAKSQARIEDYVSRIEATQDVESHVSMTLSALRGQQNQDQLGVLVLNDVGDDVPGKLDQYLKRVTSTMYAQEPSRFMRATLGMAAELSATKNDVLLARVQDLWKTTKALVDDEPRWKLTAHLAVQGTSSAADVPVSEHNVQINEATHPETYDVVCSQLRAAAEKRGAQLSKIVMNDLERRLLRRWQDSWFETFLIAIILLNCVERMCWLYRTWDDSQWHSKWPLDNRPEHYFQQGERFSDMLLMLLKMRNIPPKTQTGPDDGFLHPVDKSHEAASRWFDMLQLTNDHLEDRRSANFDPMDSGSLELTFCSKLLLSTG